MYRIKSCHPEKAAKQLSEKNQIFTFIEGPFHVVQTWPEGPRHFRWWSPAQIDFKRCAERLAPSMKCIPWHHDVLTKGRQRPDKYLVMKNSSWWFEPAAWLWGSQNYLWPCIKPKFFHRGYGGRKGRLTQARTTSSDYLGSVKAPRVFPLPPFNGPCSIYITTLWQSWSSIGLCQYMYINTHTYIYIWNCHVLTNHPSLNDQTTPHLKFI